MTEYEVRLKEAQAVQAGVLEGVRGSSPDVVAPHGQAAADIQTELAVLYCKQQKLKEVLLAACRSLWSTMHSCITCRTTTHMCT